MKTEIKETIKNWAFKPGIQIAVFALVGLLAAKGLWSLGASAKVFTRIMAPGRSYDEIAYSAPAQFDALESNRLSSKTAHMNIEVKNYQESRSSIINTAGTFNAEILEDQSWRVEGRGESGRMVIAAEPDRLGSLMDSLAALGTVKSRSLAVSDVTDSHRELETRLSMQKSLRSRFEQLLKTQAGRLRDVLMVEQELARVQREIEMLEGRIRAMNNRIERSRLEIHLEEESYQLTPVKNNLLLQLQDAARRAWNSFWSTVTALLTFLGLLAGVGVYMALAAAVYFAVQRLRRSGKPEAGDIR